MQFFKNITVISFIIIILLCYYNDSFAIESGDFDINGDFTVGPIGGASVISWTGSAVSITQLNVTTSFDVNSKNITSVLDPTSNQHAATKKYVDDSITGISGYVLDIGDTITGDLILDASSDNSPKISLEGTRRGADLWIKDVAGYAVFYIESDANTGFVLKAASSIGLWANGDEDDYIQISTTNNVPFITGVGSHLSLGGTGTPSIITSISDSDVFFADDVEVAGELVASVVYSEGHIYLGYGDTSDGDEDRFIYFNDANDNTREWFKWDDGNSEFYLSDDLRINNNLKVRGNNIYINQAAGDDIDEDGFIYFNDDNDDTNHSMAWDDGGNRFIFSDDIQTGRLLLPYTVQATEPTLSGNDGFEIWVDSDDGYSVWLILYISSLGQVKIELL